jgi:hypothetical protein
MIADRIPKQTLEGWRAELEQWTVASAFRDRVDAILQPIPRLTFFSQAGLAFLRDAWIASRVASALQSNLVRLFAGQRPDFEIRTAGCIQQFEATEADVDGRRRGAEPDVVHLEPDPVENWRKRFEAIPAALDRVIAKKLAKDYQPDVRLVVYVNLGCYGAYLDEGLPILRAGTSIAKDKFKAVFVMWEGSLYKLWEDGTSAFAQCRYSQPDDF